MIEKANKNPHKRKKSILKIGMASVIITCVVGTASSFVFAKEIKVTVDDKERVLSGGMFQNVGEVLEDNGIELDDQYTVNVDTNSVLFTVDTVEVKSKASGELSFDGKTIIYQTEAKTVGDLLGEYNIELGDLDRVVPGQSTPLEDVKEVKVIRVQIDELPSRQVITYTTQNKDNPEMEVGKTKVVQVGVDGESSQVERVLYENGVEVKREVIYDEIVKAPIPEIVEVGTKAVAATPAPVVETPAVETPVTPVPVTPAPAVQTPAATASTATNSIPEGAVKMTIQCTAYTATGNATASGVMPTANHTVAAWSGLPFGTKIYIPAMGITYTVEDRGGAVTEGIVDIYMDSYEACIQFGRQNLEAYIVY
ncbi:3D domain-containing protein [Acetobacterium wieringae]|uniref:3D domain-containing protein n=1 Tax=Acetobacterium wieringae TaxID=52694 RepID=UPI0026EF7394|nr:3D domain-containing protein [Acetobacterium wieringae]